MPMLRAVLFDLDGTLVDTAPDLIGAMAHVRAGAGLPPRDFSAQHHLVSAGAPGMLAAALDRDQPVHDDELRRAFLAYYADNCWVRSQPYTGIAQVLDWLEEHGVIWGVVTNKSEALATRVMAAAGWTRRARCLVCGDTLPVAKPDPAPVRLAYTRMGVAAAETVFVGDDRRDVQAGRGAGVLTALAGWGYVVPGEDPHGLGADRVLAHPLDLLPMIDSDNRR